MGSVPTEPGLGRNAWTDGRIVVDFEFLMDSAEVGEKGGSGKQGSNTPWGLALIQPL